MKFTRIEYTIIIGLLTCLFIALFVTNSNSDAVRTKEVPKDENYVDSIRVVTDAVKDSNSSHIPY